MMDFYRRYIYLLIGIGVLINSCNTIEYAKGVQKEAYMKAIKHKERIYCLEFRGVLTQKKYCDTCRDNNWELIVMLTNEEVRRFMDENIGYPPHYSYMNDKLHLEVTERIYNNLSKGDTLFKNIGSYELCVDNNCFAWLSKKRGQWLVSSN